MEAALGVEARKEKQERPVYSRLPPSSQPYPWLIISHGTHRERHTFFSVLENHYYTKIIPELSNKYIWSSCFGWWIIQDCDTSDCFLLEPVSMTKILLPPLEVQVANQTVDCDLCVLSAVPSDPNCYVLFSGVTENTVLYCQPGVDDCFIMQKLEGQQFEAATIHDGNIYGLMFPTTTLVKITFVDKTIQFMKLMSLEEFPQLLPPPPMTFYKYYLVESCGELLLVSKIFSASFMPAIEVLDFKVFRLECKSTVVELKNIGDRAIFLDEKSGMATVSSQENGGNRIYFTQFRSLNLYVYDLRDRSISRTLPCPVVRHRYSSILKWVIMPTDSEE